MIHLQGDGRLTLRAQDYTPPPKLWVRAVGRKAGRAARCSCWFTAPMWDMGGYLLTSVALVVAAVKILRGEIKERGVMTAETAFGPLSFFEQVVALLPAPPPDGKLIRESFEWLEGTYQRILYVNVFRGPANVRKVIEGMFAQSESLRLVIDEISHVRAGDAVFAVGTATYGMQAQDGTGQQITERWTDVRVKVEGRWVYGFIAISDR